MRILVTGGAGYLGSEVCKQAMESERDVVATQLRTPPPHGRALQLDLRDDEAVPSRPAQARPGRRHSHRVPARGRVS